MQCCQFLPLVGIALLFWLFIIRPASRGGRRNSDACSRRCPCGTRSCSPPASSAPCVAIDDDHVHGRDRRRASTIKVARGAIGTDRLPRSTSRDARRRAGPPPTAPRRTDMARNAAAHAGPHPGRLLPRRRVLYGLVALGGTWKPELGLDLQGGTRITLIAEGDPSQENLDEARGIIDQRVNGSGCRRGRGHHPGQQHHRRRDPRRHRATCVETVKRQAQLRFRIVACSSAAPGPCASAAPPADPGDPSTEPGSGVTLPADPSDSPSGKASDKATSKPTTSPGERPEEPPGRLGSPTTSRPTRRRRRPRRPTRPRARRRPRPPPSDSTRPTTPSDPAPRTTADDTAGGAGVHHLDPPQAGDRRLQRLHLPRGHAAPVGRPATPLVTCGTDDDAATSTCCRRPSIEGTDLKDASAGIPQGERRSGAST